MAYNFSEKQLFFAESGDPNASQKDEDLELKKQIQDLVDANFQNMESSIKGIDDFYRSIYRIVERLSEQKEAMQYRMPSKESLKNEVDAVLNKRKFPASKAFPLTKEEVKEVIQNVVRVENFHIGKKTKDIFLYIFGIPAIGLIAKRIIPGPTASIPDEIFIPLMTSGTIAVLAKTNRI